jgi:hypothetical protein
MLSVEIRVKGRIDEDWTEWLEGFSIHYADDEAILSGAFPDQAALYGLLAKLRDLGLALLSVKHSREEDEVDM